jgi:hypothetical protein
MLLDSKVAVAAWMDSFSYFIYFAQRLLQSALYPVDHASLLKVTLFSAVIGPFSIACPAVKGKFHHLINLDKAVDGDVPTEPEAHT